MVTEASGMCPNCFAFHFVDGRCPDCGYANTAGSGSYQTLPPGTLLGNRYMVGRVLGIGGFGITYKAFDTLYKRICAIKEFAPSGLAYRQWGGLTMQVHNSSNLSYYQHGMQRFMEEAQTLKRLENVASVVQVWECFQENNTAYFVMEFLDGTDLKHVIKAMGASINSRDITDIIIKIGGARDIIHRTTNILHRDISPDNIYIVKNGGVKLLDFGSARQKTMDERQEFTVEFKKGFAPFEQYSRNGKQGPYTDVYALASTYYYSLTGVMIPDAMSRLDGRAYVPLYQMRQDITQEVSKSVDQALEVDWRKRTQTMAEFIRGISQEGEPDPVDEGNHLAEKKMTPYLEVLSGSNAGVRWKLPKDTPVVIGRSAKQSNIIIEGNPNISRSHCNLVYDGESGEFLLKDLSSSNGVFVENRRLEPQKIYRYRAEVQFMLADSKCVIKAGVSYE